MRFTRVIVVNPPSPPGYVANKDSMGGFGQLFPLGATLFPPLDMVYLASYLAEKNCPLTVFECLAHELDKQAVIGKITSLCDGDEASLTLVVFRTSAPTLDWDLTILGEIRANIKNARVAIYGPVIPSVMKRLKRETWLDYIIQGDPDETVYQIMTSDAAEAIDGVTYRHEDKWVTNPSKPLIRELDSLPFPKWELLPYEKYRLPKSSTSAEKTFLPMLTSRGCPIGCHYCPYPIGQGLPWRYRSAENVVDEIEHLVKDLGIQYILFRDPMFSLNQKRVVQICDEVVRRGLKFEWRCETRVDFLNEETLTAMAKAGCEGINFGVESSDVEIQLGVGRKAITQEQFIASFNLCRKLGIKTFGFFIIGLPGDTVETILKTIQFALEIKPNWVQFTAAAPFIGTKLRDWAVAQGFVAEDEYAYISSHETQIGNENLSKEQVRSLHRFAQLMQNYVLNRRGILKDDNRSFPLYKAAKIVTDVTFNGVARVMFAGAKVWFGRSYTPPAKERVA